MWNFLFIIPQKFCSSSYLLLYNAQNPNVDQFMTVSHSVCLTGLGSCLGSLVQLQSEESGLLITSGLPEDSTSLGIYMIGSFQWLLAGSSAVIVNKSAYPHPGCMLMGSHWDLVRECSHRGHLMSDHLQETREEAPKLLIFQAQKSQNITSATVSWFSKVQDQPRSKGEGGQALPLFLKFFKN